MKVKFKKTLALILCFAMIFSLCSGLIVSNAATEQKVISTTYANCGVNVHLKTTVTAKFINGTQFPGSEATTEVKETCTDSDNDGMCDSCNVAISSSDKPEFRYVFGLEYDNNNDDSLVKVTLSIIRSDIQDGATYLIRGIDFSTRFGEGLSPVYTTADKKASEFADVLIPDAIKDNNVAVPITVNDNRTSDGNLTYQEKASDKLSNPDVNQLLHLVYDNLDPETRNNGYITMNKEQPIYSFYIKKADVSQGIKSMNIYKESFNIYFPLDTTKYTGEGQDIDLATPQLIYDPNGTVLTYNNMSYGKDCPESVYAEEYPKVNDEWQKVTSLISSKNMVTPVGYTFEGWHVKTSSGMSDEKLDVTKKNPLVMNTTWYLIAKWEPIKYTATFVNKYGSKVATTNPIYLTVEDYDIDDDETPEVPKITGYTGKWQENPFDPKNPSNVIIKPEYTPIEYTVTYDANGGIVNDNDKPQTYTVTDKVTLRTASRDGYTFAGWDVTSNSSNWGSSISNSATTVGPSKYGDVTLTAKWEKKSYNVTWDGGNKGTVKNTSGKMVSSFSQTVPYDDEIIAPEATRVNASILGWDVDGDKQVDLDADGKGITTKTANGINIIAGQVPRMPYKDITIMAIWNVVKYPLIVSYVMSDKTTFPTHDKNGNKIENGKEYDYEQGDNYSIEAPQIEGYSPDRTYVKGVMPAEAKTEVVTYTPNKHKITWDADGGKLTDKDGNQVSSITDSANYGDPISSVVKKPENNPEKDGYIFKGWTAVDGDKEITPEDLLSTVKTMPDKDYTFKPKWEAIQYVVALNLNGGSLKDDAWSAYTGEESDIPSTLINGESDELATIEYYMPYTADSSEKLPMPTRKGYSLKEWKVTVVAADQGESSSWTVGKTYSKNYALAGNYGSVRLDAVWESTKKSDSTPTPDPDPDSDTEPTDPDSKTDLLDDSNHYSYLCGYDKDDDDIAEVIQPEKSITRAEIATVLFRLLENDVREKYLTKENHYSDVHSIWWYNTAVSTLSNAGIINGYKDGTYRPQEPVTRAELAVMLTRFLKTELKDSSTDPGFADVSVTTHWAYKEICIAANAGLIEGFTNGSQKLFKPEKYITRAETATMINRILNRNPEEPADLLSNMKKFNDNMDTSAWYYLAMQEASNSHDYVRKISGVENWTKIIASPDWLAYEK